MYISGGILTVICPRECCRGRIEIDVNIDNFQQEALDCERNGNGYHLSKTIDETATCSACKKESTVSFTASATVMPKSNKS